MSTVVRGTQCDCLNTTVLFNPLSESLISSSEVWIHEGSRGRADATEGVGVSCHVLQLLQVLCTFAFVPRLDGFCRYPVDVDDPKVLPCVFCFWNLNGHVLRSQYRNTCFKVNTSDPVASVKSSNGIPTADHCRAGEALGEIVRGSIDTKFASRLRDRGARAENHRESDRGVLRDNRRPRKVPRGREERKG